MQLFKFASNYDHITYVIAKNKKEAKQKMCEKYPLLDIDNDYIISINPIKIDKDNTSSKTLNAYAILFSDNNKPFQVYYANDFYNMIVIISDSFKNALSAFEQFFPYIDIARLRGIEKLDKEIIF